MKFVKNIVMALLFSTIGFSYVKPITLTLPFIKDYKMDLALGKITKIATFVGVGSLFAYGVYRFVVGVRINMFCNYFIDYSNNKNKPKANAFIENYIAGLNKKKQSQIKQKVAEFRVARAFDKVSIITQMKEILES